MQGRKGKGAGLKRGGVWRRNPKSIPVPNFDTVGFLRGTSINI